MANLQKNKVNKIRGFSLVEMAVVLGIVGVLGAGTGLMYSEQKNQAEWQESQAKLKVVKSAILKFAEVNKYMPCPADSSSTNGMESRKAKKGKLPAIPAIPATPAIPGTATSPTIPAIPSEGAQPAIPNIDVSTCSVNKGTVPYASIGLSKADVHDPWGHPFIYSVDQGVTSADAMLDCPNNTACFFNGSEKPAGIPADRKFAALPAFNTSTQPLKGVLGANNLEICTDSGCSVTQADGLVAVLLASNDDGSTASTVSDGEVQNQKGQKTYVNQTSSKEPFYDDVVLGVSAYEIKNSSESRVIENVVAAPPAPAGPVTQTGNDLQNMGDNTLGESGTNVGTDNVTWDNVNQTFDFGEDAANKNVVLTYDSHASGTWDQPKNKKDKTTSDTAYVNANGDQVEEYKYDFTDDTQTGYEQETFDVLNSRYYTGYNEDGSEYTTWIKAGTQHTTYTDYWDASHESVVQLDENGQVSLDFGVGTTANYETIDFTNIQLVYYDTPPDMPSFPKVAPISGIDQTQDLN